MVRLEKIAYEQIVNSNVFGRTRKLAAPKKWFTTNPLYHARNLSYQFFNSYVGRFLALFYKPWFNYERSFQRDVLLQRGLTFEDGFLHTDTQLRRCPLFEHMARQCLHPYHWILKVRRRERYFKINRVSAGFFVPDFIRSQAKTQTYRDYQRVREQWRNFKHDNYFSDMTPSARRTVLPQVIAIDSLFNYGVLKREAWERYFFSERNNSWYTPEQVEWTKDPRKFPFDLTSAEGKRQFETYVKDLNENYPGLASVEGQKFDFQKYYAELGV